MQHSLTHLRIRLRSKRAGVEIEDDGLRLLKEETVWAGLETDKAAVRVPKKNAPETQVLGAGATCTGAWRVGDRVRGRASTQKNNPDCGDLFRRS